MLKIMNVKMVVDEEGNEVRADDALFLLSKLEAGEKRSYENLGFEYPYLCSLLTNAKAIKGVKELGISWVRKGERFAEVYAWLKEMLEEE